MKNIFDSMTRKSPGFRYAGIICLCRPVIVGLALFLTLISNKAVAQSQLGNITDPGAPPGGANDIGITFTYVNAIVPVATGLGLSTDGGKTWSQSSSSTDNLNPSTSPPSGNADLFGTIPATGPNTFSIKVTPDVNITSWWYTRNGANIDPIDPKTGFPAIYTFGITYSPSPVPEPATLGLLALGAVILFVRRQS
jgi:hypothetical protein